MSEEKKESAIPKDASTAEPSKAFFKSDKIDDPQVVRKLILDGAERMAEGIIWVAGEKEHIKTRIPNEVGRDQIIHFGPPVHMIPSFEPKSFEKAFEEKLYPEMMIRLYLPGAAILGFKSKLLGADEDGYRFEMPTTAVLMQRRKHRRFTIPGAYEMTVDVPHPKSPKLTLSKKLIDVSVEGISFLVAKTEGESYRVGRMLPNMTITIRGRELKVSAEVKNVRDYPGANHLAGVQVGAKIIQIGEEDADFLTSFVEEMLIQYSRNDHTNQGVKTDKK